MLNNVSNEKQKISSWNYWSYVSQDLKNKMSKLDISIKTLQNRINDFKQRGDIYSLKLAKDIIFNALHKSAYHNKTLLERHYSRLEASICEDLKRNWYKFDRSLNSKLFEQISQCITNELVETTFFKRWAPLNWTYAALYLYRSKLIAPEISLMINSWTDIEQLTYIELPIFTDNQRVLTIPIAKIVIDNEEIDNEEIDKHLVAV